jgi:hypothetical protein
MASSAADDAKLSDKTRDVRQFRIRPSKLSPYPTTADYGDE